ncbi:MAG: hypothetical protein MUC36_16480 [Planctomycetes bacterium]|jgi:hypothetical protein|nr:hypothetical protein [Planctomycetota bacterium]
MIRPFTVAALSTSLFLCNAVGAQVTVTVPDGAGSPSAPPSPGQVDLCDANPGSNTQVVEVIADPSRADKTFKAQKIGKDGNPVGPVREISATSGFPFSLGEGEKVVAWDSDDPSSEDDKAPGATVKVS